MSDQAATFRSLHCAPLPLRLVNAWDRLSARTFALAGAPAVGTSSFAVALARGYPDGQHISGGELVDAVAAIASSVDVPVTVDIEAGYGVDLADVERLVGDVIGAGAVGINLEDGRPDAPGQLFSVEDQCRRLSAARHRAEREGVELFINARCDVYFGAQLAAEARMPTTLGRLRAYVEAGADGVFLPGLIDLDGIAEVVNTI